MAVEFHRDGPWELPEGWVWARLGDLGQWSGGGTPSKSNAVFWTNGTIPWISPKDMKQDFVGDSPDRITQDAVTSSTTKLVRENSVLMVVRSGILNHTFPVAVSDREVTINQDMRALAPHEGINARYLMFILRRLQRNILHECSKDGTTVASVEPAKLENVFVPLAPEAEQRRIVARIDELFTEVADGETALTQARDDLDTWRRALLKAAVTGELTREWREANVVSDDWSWATIGEAGELRLGRQRSPQHHQGKHMRPYLRVANVFEARLDLTDVKSMNFTPDEFEIYRLKPGDVLLNEGQSPHLLGRPAIFRGEVDGCCFQNTLLRFRPHEGLTSEFALLVFRHYMHSGRFRRESRITTNLAHLSQSRCAAIEFPMPSAAEQIEIVQTVQVLEEQAFEQFEHIEISALGSLRQSILKAAFEGLLSERDPRDEPAGRLLARLNEQADADTSVPHNIRARRTTIAAE